MLNAARNALLGLFILWILACGALGAWATITYLNAEPEIQTKLQIVAVGTAGVFGALPLGIWAFKRLVLDRETGS